MRVDDDSTSAVRGNRVWWCEAHGWNGWSDKDVCLWQQMALEAGTSHGACSLSWKLLTEDYGPPIHYHTDPPFGSDAYWDSDTVDIRFCTDSHEGR